eukprot:TRINITY_DN7159_c0_g1_i6.p7 TRINITY_DN7159_c0_g1~~TRINITY_DN7159_c0_g1_i6.p7  ORF type:complete len:116 (-),score=2.41 TRINITY_DN7159_c0_g1_i6:393-740(-)
MFLKYAKLQSTKPIKVSQKKKKKKKQKIYFNTVEFGCWEVDGVIKNYFLIGEILGGKGVNLRENYEFTKSFFILGQDSSQNHFKKFQSVCSNVCVCIKILVAAQILFYLLLYGQI